MTTVASVTTVGPSDDDDPYLLCTTSNSTRLYLYCPITICSKVYSLGLSRIGLVDTGAEVNVIGRYLLPADFEKRVSCTPCKVRGISGVVEDTIKFHADVNIGESYFERVEIVVMENPVADIVVGLPLLRHASVEKFSINWRTEVIQFTRVIGDRKVEQSIQGESPQNVLNNALIPENADMSAAKKLEFLRNELKLKLQWPNASELEKMAELLYEFRSLFDDTTGKFPNEVSIKTRGDPIAKNQHVIPLKHRGKVDDEIKKMLESGVIEPCSDGRGWRTPLLTVTKPDGDIRVCCNYKRTLNLRLVDEEVYSQKPADELFASIRPGAKYFASMDLKKGYWQLVIRVEDRYKTCFQYESKLYQFCRLPFGLRTAGGLFCRAIGTALDTVDFDKSSTLVYLDDITTLNADFDTFMAATRKVLEALKKFNLKLSAKKCAFLTPEAKFLGRVLNSKGMRPDPENVSGILKMVAPKTRKELQSLIGSLNWVRQFIGEKMGKRVSIESFSHRMFPINACNRDGKFLWTKEADLALKQIKEKLTEAPFISFYCPTLPLVLFTDASKYAAGAVLMQRAGEDDYRVIGAISKTFTRTELNWSCTEKEAYAIKWAVEKFAYYLASEPFTVMSDHRALTFIDRTEFKNLKVARWQEYLSSYSFTVQYIEGRENTFADWLSRGCEKLPTPKTRLGQSKPAGTFMDIARVENGKNVQTGLKIYIPSWVRKNLVKTQKLELCAVSDSSDINYASLCPFSENERFETLRGPSVCIAQKVVETDGEVFRHQSVLESQLADPFYSKIMNALKCTAENEEKRVSKVITAIGENDHRSGQFTKMASGLFLDIATGLLCSRSTRGVQLIVPDVMISGLLFAAHDNLAHAGMERVRGYLAPYFWPGKKADIYNYVRSCLSCTRVKGTEGQRKIRSGRNLKGESKFDIIYLDYVTMPAESGYRYCLTLIDAFTRFLCVWPLRSNSARDTSRCLVNFVAQHRIIPRVISSDRGTHFTGQLFREVCNALNIKQNLHVSWRPQSTGILERQHRTLKNALYIAAKERQSPWHQVLPMVVSSLNATFNSATKVSPFEAVMGHAGRFGLPNLDQLRSENACDYALETNQALKTIHDNVRVANRLTDEKYLAKVNAGQLRENVQVGDAVCLYRPMSSEATKKEPWIGRFIVLDTNDFVTRIQNENDKSTEWVSNHHIRRIVPRDKKLQIPITDDASDPELVPPEPKSPPKPPPVQTESRGGSRDSDSVSKSQPQPKKVTRQKKKPSTDQPLRRSSRNRTQTKLTNIDSMNSKSYAFVVRDIPSELCPSE